MQASRTRRTLAAVIDGALAFLPATLVLITLVALAISLYSAGPLAALIYGPPVVVFTGPSIVWGWWAWGRHRNCAGGRTIGHAVSGTAVAPDGSIVYVLPDRSARGFIVRGAAAASGALALVAATLIAVHVATLAIGPFWPADPGETYVAQSVGQLGSTVTHDRLMSALAQAAYTDVVAMAEPSALADVERFVADAEGLQVLCYLPETSSSGTGPNGVEATYTVWEYAEDGGGQTVRRRVMFDLRQAPPGADGTPVREIRLASIVRSSAAQPVDFVPATTETW